MSCCLWKKEGTRWNNPPSILILRPREARHQSATRQPRGSQQWKLAVLYFWWSLLMHHVSWCLLGLNDKGPPQLNSVRRARTPACQGLGGAPIFPVPSRQQKLGGLFSTGGLQTVACGLLFSRPAFGQVHGLWSPLTPWQANELKEKGLYDFFFIMAQACFCKTNMYIILSTCKSI